MNLNILLQPESLRCSLIVILLGVSTFTELKSNRIPNWLTYGGILLGLASALFTGAFKPALIGFLVGFVCMFIVYLAGGLGAGDVKLMAAFGALLGFPYILRVLIYTSFIGAVMAVVLLIVKTDPWQVIKNVMQRKPNTAVDQSDFKRLTIPYGLAICGGVLFAMFFSPVTG